MILEKAVSDEMIPLEKNFDSNYSNYGLAKIGYPDHSISEAEFYINNSKVKLRNALANRKKFRS